MKNPFRPADVGLLSPSFEKALDLVIEHVNHRLRDAKDELRATGQIHVVIPEVIDGWLIRYNYALEAIPCFKKAGWLVERAETHHIFRGTTNYWTGDTNYWNFRPEYFK